MYGVYTVFLAGELSNIRSYTVYIYGSGQPMSVLCTCLLRQVHRRYDAWALWLKGVLFTCLLRRVRRRYDVMTHGRYGPRASCVHFF